MALSRKLLTPVSSGIKNPMATVIKEVEAIARKHCPQDYVQNELPIIRKKFVSSALGIEAYGSSMNAAIKNAPHIQLSIALEEFKTLLGGCYYFTSQYWRAFYYWLDKKGKVNPRWPQFGEDEAVATLGSLSEQQIKKVRVLAKEVWPERPIDDRINYVLKKVNPRINQLCYNKLRFLTKYDPALYSLEDLQQEIIYQMIFKLRVTDWFDDKPEKLIGWALTCVDNTVRHIIDKSTADCRAKIVRTVEGGKDGEDKFLLRECALSTPVRETDEGVPLTLADSIRLLGESPFQHVDEADDTVFFHELIEKAKGTKIQEYLEILWGGKHNEHFWSWFQKNQPELAEQEAYVQENPEAIGGWVQRYLGIRTGGPNGLLAFFRDNAPELFDYCNENQMKKVHRYLRTA